MKAIIKILFFLIIPFSFFSCDEMNERVLPSPSGKSGDLLVVMDSLYYNNKAGEAVKQIFSQEQVGLPQREPLFNIIHVPHRSFARIFHPMRNIIMVHIKPKSKIKLEVRKEVWSETQLVVTITAPNDKLAAETVTKNASALLDYFNNKELSRLQNKYRVNTNSKNAQYINKKFGLTLNLDELYIVAQEADDFLWMRKEKTAGGHQISQGVMIYTYPYVSDSTFKVSNLMKKRNFYTKNYVSGTNDGSYMLSYKEYVPIQKEISLNGVYVNELRGLWHMHQDFMGGPFVNYTLVDKKNNRVICIDGYVYSPKFNKREFLREQEALIKTITF
ncbi:MAG: DUF4837 family protein [Flavobacteriales bacterium]|nr:DUF4837 family protein [Flavobacteriales bacterium]